MTQAPKFCQSCGAALRPGARFCEGCGRELAQPAGREQTPAPQVNGPAQVQGTGQPAPTAPETVVKKPEGRGPRGLISRMFLFGVGLLLLTYGAKGPVLAVAGETTTGVVTEFQRDRTPPMFSFLPKGNNDYVVSFGYQVAGETHKGATTLYELHNTSKFSQGSVQIHYLKVWPDVSDLADRDPINMAELAALGSGVLILLAFFAGALA